MTAAKTKPNLLPFDAARYLTDDAAIAEYMSAVLESGDPDLLLLALSDVARARGMAQVAMAPGAKPQFETVIKVMTALGIQMQARVSSPI